MSEPIISQVDGVKREKYNFDKRQWEQVEPVVMDYQGGPMKTLDTIEGQMKAIENARTLNDFLEGDEQPLTDQELLTAARHCAENADTGNFDGVYALRNGMLNLVELLERMSKPPVMSFKYSTLEAGSGPTKEEVERLTESLKTDGVVALPSWAGIHYSRNLQQEHPAFAWKPRVGEMVEMTVRCVVREINGDKAIVGIAHHDATVPVSNLRKLSVS